MKRIESVAEKLARLRCMLGDMASKKHKACKCMNCAAYKRMLKDDGVGRDILVHSDGNSCCVIEGSDM